MDALSSCAPQANSQPEPPIAQAPKPTGVMNRSEFPSCFVFIVPSVLVFIILFYLCTSHSNFGGTALPRFKVRQTLLTPKSNRAAAQFYCSLVQHGRCPLGQVSGSR